jgi:hypothetical protein
MEGRQRRRPPLVAASGSLVGRRASGASAAYPRGRSQVVTPVRWRDKESKTPDGPGLGATWPGRGLDTLLAAHGFTEAGRVASQAGYVVLPAIPTAAHHRE